MDAVFRRGQRSAQHAPGDGGDPGALRPGDPQNPGRGAPHRPGLPAALAHDRPAQPEGLDSAARGGWAQPGRLLAGAPDPARRTLPPILGNLQMLEAWMRSYKPEELFDATGGLLPELKALAPKGIRRMSANPVANGGLLRKPLVMPDFREYAVEGREARRDSERETCPSSAISCARSCGRTCRTSAYLGPDETRPTGCRRSTKPPRKHGWRNIFPRMPTAAISRRTAASWRCSASTQWKGGWRATF